MIQEMHSISSLSLWNMFSNIWTDSQTTFKKYSHIFIWLSCTDMRNAYLLMYMCKLVLGHIYLTGKLYTMLGGGFTSYIQYSNFLPTTTLPLFFTFWQFLWFCQFLFNVYNRSQNNLDNFVISKLVTLSQKTGTPNMTYYCNCSQQLSRQNYIKCTREVQCSFKK